MQTVVVTQHRDRTEVEVFTAEDLSAGTLEFTFGAVEFIRPFAQSAEWRLEHRRCPEVLLCDQLTPMERARLRRHGRCCAPVDAVAE